MHVIHLRGGDKAAWARLNRDQDILVQFLGL